MACRLLNLHKYPMYIDLRGGETLVLSPGETSRALLEELLYDNHHLPEWEAAGWVARLPARFAETQPQAQAGAPAEEAEAKPSDEAADETADEAADEASDETEDETKDGSDATSPKRRRRRTHR